MPLSPLDRSGVPLVTVGIANVAAAANLDGLNPNRLNVVQRLLGMASN